ncbi:phage tail protein [Mesorhizobium sp. SP-1A]|uniref:phage tail protein n=1 Tax=Mesorhizobium sp. SP-1A TaxID=3077840 RepID=UPI0028F726FC|nr:phage tail protein [Mesorhizobium sp. SP-1A]
MVKTPKTRHSRNRREPVTIELEPDAVSRIPQDQPETDSQAAEALSADQKAAEPAASPEPEAAGVDTQAPTGSDEHTQAAEAAQPSDEPSGIGAEGYGFAEQPQPAGSAQDTAHEREYATTPPPRERGGMNAVVAGLAGAVIALVGAGALQYAGLIGGPGSSLDGVNSQIAALKGEMAAAKQGNSANDALARLNDLSAALDKVRADLAAVKKTAEAGSGGDTGTALDALGDKVAALETTVAALNQAAGQQVDLGPVNEKLAALDTQVKSSADAVAREDGRLGALEQSVSQLTGKVEAQASQPKIALSIAASALKSALERGAPFTAELDTFAAISPDAPQVAALRPYAEKGVPSRADIATGMDAAANAMVGASEQVDENAGLFARLMSSAESLVKVRPVGAIAGPGVPETVARMEVAVKQGDYAKALAEYGTLPEAVKAAGAGFADKIKARLEAETQVDALVSSAMKA